MKRRLSHDVARYVPGLVVPIAVGTLSTIVFARIATPDELGRFLLVVALATSVGTPCGQWLEQAVLRFYPTYALEGRLGVFLRAVSVLALVSGAVASLIVVSVLWATAGSDQVGPTELVPAAGIVFFATASAGRGAVLQASFALNRYSSLKSMFAVAKFGLPLLLLGALGPLAALLWGTALAGFAAWLVLMWQTPSGVRAGDQSASVQDVIRIGRQAAGYGVPLTVSEIGVQILQFSDRYVIALVLGAAAVGLYGTNYSIAEKLVILVQAPIIYAAHSPIVAAWERGDRQETLALIRTATRWLIIFGAPLVAFSAVRGELISELLLGEAYAAGHVVIPIAAAAILVYAVSQYGHKCFELGRQTWIITVALLVAAAVNTAAVVGLTLAVGFVGGALGTAVGYAAYAVLIFFLSRGRRSPFPWAVPWRTLVCALLAAALAGASWATLAPLRVADVVQLIWLGAAGLAGMVVYTVVLAGLGELPFSLRDALRRTPKGAASLRGDEAATRLR